MQTSHVEMVGSVPSRNEGQGRNFDSLKVALAKYWLVLYSVV